MIRLLGVVALSVAGTCFAIWRSRAEQYDVAKDDLGPYEKNISGIEISKWKRRFIVSLVVGLMLFGVDAARAQSERDWQNAVLMIGPARVDVPAPQPVLVFHKRTVVWLRLIQPAEHFRISLLSIVKDVDVECQLLTPPGPSNDVFEAAYCRTPTYPDIAAELIRRGTAVPDTRSGKPRK